MNEDPVIVLAATTRGWASRLRAHAADHGGVLIRATVLRPEDALAERSAVVLLDDVTSFLTPAFVAQLQDQGRAVLGLYDPGDSQGKGDLVEAGVDALVASDCQPDELVTQIRNLASRHPEDRVARPAARPSAVAPSTSRIVGVVGPQGGVGVTEVALEVAAVLAASDLPTALVDVDELEPGLAQRLGLPVHPNLHTALHAVEHTRTVDEHLHPIATRRPLHVLPGMAAPQDWQTVAQGSPAKLLDALSARHRAVVLDLGHALPLVEGPTGARFGRAVDLVSRCDDLLLVLRPTPVSISRGIALVARLQAHSRRLHLVLNQTDRDRFVRDEAVGELQRATGIHTVHLLSADPAVARAGWQGSRAGRGRFRRDVGQMVATLGLAGAG